MLPGSCCCRASVVSTPQMFASMCSHPARVCCRTTFPAQAFSAGALAPHPGGKQRLPVGCVHVLEPKLLCTARVLHIPARSCLIGPCRSESSTSQLTPCNLGAGDVHVARVLSSAGSPRRQSVGAWALCSAWGPASPLTTPPSTSVHDLQGQVDGGRCMPAQPTPPGWMVWRQLPATMTAV